jgi:non-ribosomal peptide synthetase component F
MSDKLLIDNIEDACFYQKSLIAIIDEGIKETITYHELELRYKSLSEQLIAIINYEKASKADTSLPPLVAILTNKNIGSIIAPIAVLRSHSAFIPIDPDLPSSYQLQILQHSKAQILLIDEENFTKIGKIWTPVELPPIIVIDRNGRFIHRYGGSIYDNFQTPTNSKKKDPILYILYKNEVIEGRLSDLGGEEGETLEGVAPNNNKANAVMITNAGIRNVLKFFISYLRLNDTDKVLSLMPLSCDASLIEIFIPLIIGGTLVLGTSTATIEDPQRLMTVIDKYHITLLQGTTRMFEALLDNEWNGKKDLQLMIANENGFNNFFDISNPFATRLYSLVNKCRNVYLVYGHSETCIWSSCYWLENQNLTGNDNGNGMLPKFPEIRLSSALTASQPTCQFLIGQPISNTTFYILNKRLQPVKPGQLGELYIGGSGLAKGYLYNNKQTKMKFIKNPFVENRYSRLYKTGQIVCKIRNSLTNGWDYICIDGLKPEIVLQDDLLSVSIDICRSLSNDFISLTTKSLPKLFSGLLGSASTRVQKAIIPFSPSSSIADEANVNGGDNTTDLPKGQISSFTSVTTQATDQSNASTGAVPSSNSGGVTSNNTNNNLLNRNRRRSSVLKKALIIPSGHCYQPPESVLNDGNNGLGTLLTLSQDQGEEEQEKEEGRENGGSQRKKSSGLATEGNEDEEEEDEDEEDEAEENEAEEDGNQKEEVQQQQNDPTSLNSNQDQTQTLQGSRRQTRQAILISTPSFKSNKSGGGAANGVLSPQSSASPFPTTASIQVNVSSPLEFSQPVQLLVGRQLSFR